MSLERKDFTPSGNSSERPSSEKTEGASRRDFLKRLGMTLAVVGAGGLGVGEYFRGGDDEKRLGGDMEKYLQSDTDPEQKQGSDNEKLKNPNIAIDFFFSQHSTPEDFKGLSERVAGADVVTIEAVGWTPWSEITWNEVSAGDMTPAEALARIPNGNDRDRAMAMLQSVYRSHKIIKFIDVPEGHPLVKKIAGSISAIDERAYDYSGDFQKTLDVLKKDYADYAEFQEEREQYMLSRLKEVAKEQSDSMQKQKLNILISIGAAHTSMWHELKKEKKDARAEFNTAPHQPFIFGFSTEIFRRNIFGKEVDNLLLARVHFEATLSGLLKMPTNNTEKKDRFLRKLISQFNFDEIKETFNQLSGQEKESASKKIIEVLQAKGISFPKTEDALDEFLMEPTLKP